MPHDEETTSDRSILMQVPRNSKLRDEFACPITQELFSDPVIASGTVFLRFY